MSTTTNSSGIARQTIDAYSIDESSQMGKFKKNLMVSKGTMLAGLLATLALVLFMMFGPELEGKAAAFISFLLVLGVCLFVGGLVAVATPAIDMVVFQKFAAMQDELRKCEELEKKEEVFELLRVVCSSTDPKKELEMRDEAFTSFFW